MFGALDVGRGVRKLVVDVAVIDNFAAEVHDDHLPVVLVSSGWLGAQLESINSAVVTRASWPCIRFLIGSNTDMAAGVG